MPETTARPALSDHLSIDPAKGLDLPGTPASTPDESNLVVQPSPTPAQSTPNVRSLAAMTQELLTARTARAQLEASVQNTFSRIAQTGVVDPEEATHTVHAISAVAQALNTHALFMAFNQGRTGNAPLSQHALASCSFSMILAHAADYNLMAIQELATGALLHDIGLMQVPPNMGADYAAEFRKMFPELAQEHGAVLIPFVLAGIAVWVVRRNAGVAPEVVKDAWVDDLVDDEP